MLYTTVVLVLGIYLGQEYTIIPRISVLVISMLNYLNQVQKEQEEKSGIAVSKTSYYTHFMNKIIESWLGPKQE